MTYNRYVNQNGSHKRLQVPEKKEARPREAAVPPRSGPQNNTGASMFPDLNGIGRMLNNILPNQFDNGDLLLFAVLLLIYLDSRDIEPLIMLGVLIFMK